MEFKSQIATTREQSERMLALGIKPETADMVYLYINPKNVASYRNAINKHFVRVGSSFIKPEVERLEMTRTGWEKVLK